MVAPDPLIPRSVLFRNPDRAAPRLSPGGQYLSFLGDVDGVLNLWLAPREHPERATVVTNFKRRGITQYYWAFDDRHILFPLDEEATENWHINALDTATNEVMDLTPLGPVSARVVRLSPHFPTRVVLAVNDRDARVHDLYDVDLLTGERIRLEENPGFLRYVVDARNRPRFAVRLQPDGGQEILRQTESGLWEPVITVGIEDQMTTEIEGFDSVKRLVYLRDSRGRNTAAFTCLDLENNVTTVLAEDHRVDLGSVLFDPTTEEPQAVTFYFDRVEWRCLDPEIERDYEFLRSVDDGDISVVSQQLDASRWVVAFIRDNGPAKFYCYDRQRRHAEFLFPNFRNLAGLRLARIYPVVIRSRDKLEILCYLQLPLWKDPGNGRPNAPLPLIVLVHGGPWARDVWGFNPSSQWLANRGYATLSVNFRGSAGFGKAFLNAGNREWGGRMQDDLLAAIDWAIREGIADGERVAIMGNSYGGYAALAGLALTPDRFACAVDICGPANLVTFLETAPVYWQPMLEMLTARIGDHRTEEGRRFLWERSPLAHVSDIRRPLLIVHGARDPRVSRAESDRIVDALRGSGIPVIYLLFPDEGHGIVRPENANAFSAVAEVFLSRFMGSRCEPIGDALAGSSVEIREGAEWLR
jgi:dipeptidyl aminopeptidase/acylaminoacyl peptidase